MNKVIIDEFTKLVVFIQEQLNDALLDKKKNDANKVNNSYELMKLKVELL